MKSISQCLLVAALCVAAPLSSIGDTREDAALPLTSRVIIGSLTGAADKLVQLANAIPEEKYDWAPMEGVSSVRGILVHVSGANYYIGQMLGAKVPEGFNPQKIGEGMDKAGLIATYQASVDFARRAIAGVSATDMAEEIEMWGQRSPRAQLAMVLVDHGHEHLGQMIAYARSNGVVPPWSK